jgi:methylmalonyl-CoA epimerase
MSQPLRIDHIGIAVKSIAESKSLYEGGLGIALTHEEEVKEQGVRVGFVPLGESEIELLEPLSAESTVARFIEKRGEGIHHICLRVTNIETVLAEMEARGIRLIDRTPRIGAGGKKIAFVHPSGANGVLIELAEEA